MLFPKWESHREQFLYKKTGVFINHFIMKRSRNYLLMALIAVLGFAFGLAFDNLVSKSYANTNGETTDLTFPASDAMEVLSAGSTRSADYEIVYVYGKKYIVFSSGSDIEVLEY